MPSSAQTSLEGDTDQESDGLRPSLAGHRWDSDTESTASNSREPGPYASPRGIESPIFEAVTSDASSYRPTGNGKDGQFEVNFREQRSSSSRSPEEQVATKEKDSNYHNLQADPGSDVDLEKGLNFVKPEEGKLADDDDEEEEQHETEEKTECRVCHLAVDTQSIAGEVMELGCDCKDDLAVAHRQCAEAWFKIKGNRTCEICGSTAQNVAGIEDANFLDQWNDQDASTSARDEPSRSWQSQALCNFMLACIVLAFILSWLFRITIF